MYRPEWLGDGGVLLKVRSDESNVIAVRDDFEIPFVVFSRSEVKEVVKCMASDRKAEACRGRRVGRSVGRRRGRVKYWP